MTGKILWSLMMSSALLVAAYAATALRWPSLRTPFVEELFSISPSAIALHLAGGIVAIVLGALQLNSRIRSKYLSAHRWLGRIYVASVIVGGTAGLVLATRSTGGLVTHFGFGMMAVCWVGSTLTAYRYIRAKNVSAHQDWMLRSYALTLAAVTLRIYLGISQANGMDFVPAYQAISWMCWVPNLLIVEWFVIGRQQRRPHNSSR